MQSSWLSSLSKALKDRSPEILTGIGIGGVIVTAVLAVRATPRAVKRLEENKDLSMTRMEKVQLCWKFYIPAGLSGAATIACIAGANSIGSRRNAALVAAYTLVDTTFRDYKDEVIKQFGEKKEEKVHDAAIQRQMERVPAQGNVFITGDGDQPVFDHFTGRMFRSSVEAIRKAANDLNQRILQDMSASHNEFYELLGLPPVDVGDHLGWNIDNLLEIDFSGHVNECGIPCIGIKYARFPRPEYYKHF